MTKLLNEKSLLPPNSTEFEKSLENATKFKVEAGLLRGFKFKNNASILEYLVWEYNLGDILECLQNGDIISDGLKFQRTRGTKAAIKIAANWAGLDDIEICEEYPSVHFYEFQIGVKKRQFDFDIELLKNVTNLAKPVRSRLSRVYNDIYDVRHFKLNESQFGDILSDDSGVKFHDLTLSFGRKNHETVDYQGISTDFGIKRIHQINSFADKIFRLDFEVLSQTEADKNNIKIEYQKQRFYKNNSPIFKENQCIERYSTFAKAAIVLSETSILGGINSCFGTYTIVEKDGTFLFGHNRLSEHSWGFKALEILERFRNETSNYSDISDNKYGISNPIMERESSNFIRLKTFANSSNRRDFYAKSKYEMNPYWSDHKHSDRSWNDDLVFGKII